MEEVGTEEKTEKEKEKCIKVQIKTCYKQERVLYYS
jgi:hypothetical protein